MNDKLSVEGYTSFSFQSDLPLSLRSFQNFLDNQLPSSVFRAKGLLWFKESEITHIFHLSGKRFTIDDTEINRKRENKIVIIGKNINHKKLNRQLNECIFHETQNID